MSTTSLDQDAQVPALGVFQFDPSSIGQGVNLFRGNLAFPLKLLSLPGRNGLTLDVTLLYHGNVQHGIDIWNLDSPTDIVGLGWNMPYERIVMGPRQSGSDVDATYFLIDQGATQRLVPILRSWSRGRLDPANVQSLRAGAVDAGLAAALRNSGISVDDRTQLAAGAAAGEWLLHDPSRERVYRLQAGSVGDPIEVSTGGQSFELESYRFWQVVYYPDYESWEIVREDGSGWSYGGSGTSLDDKQSPNTVQWGIRWGNWNGPSSSAQRQQRYAKAWNLSRIENTVGGLLVFNYSVTEQAVGSGTLTYTKECHLLEARSDLGWSLFFSYLPMTYDDTALDAPKEYLDPHKDPSTAPSRPDAYQSTYNSQCLDRISVRLPSGETHLYLQFSYYPLQNCTVRDTGNLLGYGATYKRYLKNIQAVYDADVRRPEIGFAYGFTNDVTQNRGALTQITYPSGGKTIFGYDLIQVGADDETSPGARNLTIPNPFGTGGATPRVWFGPDYVVCGWLDANSSLVLNVLTWVGRWHQAWDGWLALGQGVNVDGLAVATSDNAFVVTVPRPSGTDVYLFNRQHLSAGDWQFEDDGHDAPEAHDYSGAVQVCSGSEFFLVACQDPMAPAVDRYAWNWLTRGWDPVTRLTPAGSTAQYSIAARNNYHLVLAYDPVQTQTVFTMYYRDAYLQWHTADTLTSADLPIADLCGSFVFAPSDSFAAMTYVTQTAPEGTFDYEVQVLSWDEHFQNLALVALPDMDPGGFENLPPGLLMSIAPVVVDNNLVGSGPNILRYDGSAWTSHFLGLDFPQARDPDDDKFWYAYGPDATLKTENTSLGVSAALDSLNGFDPDSGWSSQVVMPSSAPPPDRATRFYPTITSSVLTSGGAIYSRSVYPGWATLGRDLIHAIADLSLDTTTIVNQTPAFICYMTLDDRQLPKDTNVLFLRNGNLVRGADGQPAIESFPGQQMFRLDDPAYQYRMPLSGVLPALPLGFTSYPTSASIENAPEITLHRYANESVHSPLMQFVVSSVRTDSGFDVQQRCYQYEAVSAAQDATLSVVRFQVVSAYDGCLDPARQTNGYSKRYFYNGLPPMSGSSGSQRYTALDGMLIRQEDYDSAGSLVASLEHTWDVATQVATDPSESVLRNLYGAIPRVLKTVQTLDGVPKEVDYVYSAACGAPRQMSHSYYGSTGARITSLESTRFAFEVYTEMWDWNFLQLPAQNTVQTQTDAGDPLEIVTSQVRTYRSWTSSDGLAYWAEWERWIPVDAGAPDFTWWNGGDPGPEWRRLESVVTRGGFGAPLESIDVAGRVSVTTYDDEESFPIARFVGATPQDDGAGYDGFESYQSPSWTLGPGTSLIDTDAFTGFRCVSLTQAGTLTKQVTLPATAGVHVFSAWVKTPAQASHASGLIAFEIENAATGVRVAKSLDSTGGVWQSTQWIVDLGALRLSGTTTVTLTIRASIPETGMDVRVDDIFFVPLGCQFAAFVTDPTQQWLTAVLGANGSCRRWFHNHLHEVVAQTGVAGNLLNLNAFFSCLQTTPELDPANPNRTLTITGRGDGFFDEFRDGALAGYELLNGTAADWTIEGGALRLVSSGSSPSGCAVRRSNFSGTSLAIRVLVESSPDNTIRLGTGSYDVIWSGTEWQLCRSAGGVPAVLCEEKSVGFQTEWILSVFDTRILFCANGIPIFNYTEDAIAARPHGVELGLQKPAAFSDLLVAEDLSVKITYADGLGRAVQEAVMESGNSSILTAWLYDERGNRAIAIKDSRITAQDPADPFSYFADYATNAAFGSSLWSGAPMEGPAASRYHPEDAGYPFVRQVFEASPRRRIQQIGRPGLDFAITTNGSAHVDSYAYGTNTDQGPFVYPLPVGQYSLVRHVDADGTATTVWSDGQGQEIGRTIQAGVGSSTRICSSRVLDKFGRLTALIPPTYYAQNPAQAADTSGSSAAPGSALSATYDFLGQCVGTDDPDRGSTRHAYASNGMLRFAQDARGKTEGYFHYFKYDSMNRPIEEGHCEMAWDPTVLQAHVDDATWPSEDTTWSSRRVYDGTDSTPNMVGQMWQAQVNNAGQDLADVVDTFAYDRAGNVLGVTRTVGAGTSAQTASIGHSYDAAGDLISTTDSVTGLTSINHLNPLGQIEAIDGVNDDDTTRLLLLAYTQEGQLETVSLLPAAGPLLTQGYQYNSCGWLSESSGPVFDESLQYLQGSCDGSACHTGTPARQTVTYKQGVSRTEDTCLVVDYLGRITRAGDDASERQWQLDGNGNILKRSESGQTSTYRYAGGNGNQVIAVPETGKTFVYDACGNVTSVTDAGASTLNLTYSRTTGRVQTIAVQGQGPVSQIDLLYDPSGVRTLKTSTGQSTSELFRIASQSSFLETSTGPSGVMAIRHVLAPGVTIVYANGGFYFALKDRLGSTRVLLSSKSTIAGQYSYDLYGVPAVLQAAPFPYSCLYTGQHYDAEVGLYDFRARLYDPQLQRFYSPDPVAQFFSPYVYAGCNPVLLIDPTGEIAAWIGGLLIGVAEAVVGIGLTIATGGIGGIIGAGLIAGGIGSIYYSASRKDDFKWGEFGAVTGVAAGFGLLAAGGAAVAGAYLTSASAVALADITLSTGLGAGEQVVNNGVLNTMSSRGFLDNADTSAEFGAAAGFGFGVLGAGLGRGLGMANRSILREAGADEEVAVGLGQFPGSRTAHSMLRLNDKGYHIVVDPSRNAVWEDAQLNGQNKLADWPYPGNRWGVGSNSVRESSVSVTRGRATAAAPVDARGGMVNAGRFRLYRCNNCVTNTASRLDAAGLRAPLWARLTPTLLYRWCQILGATRSW